MLKAILLGKAGRVDSDSGVNLSWRDVFRQREDLLTSVFFSRIPYLSEEGEKNILALLLPRTSAAQVGLVSEISFWPKIFIDKSRSFVEPDLLIRCQNATILVEIKSPSGARQAFSQWKAEISAFLNEDDSERHAREKEHTIFFVAVGRNATLWRSWKIQLENEFIDTGLKVNALEWSDIFSGVYRLSQTECGRDKRIYMDWIEAFSLYGLVKPPLPFDGMLENFRSLDLPGCNAILSKMPVLNQAFQARRNSSSREWSGLLQLAKRKKLDYRYGYDKRRC